MRSRVLAATLTVLVLSACSGGGDESEGGSGGSSAPTEVEYAEAHDLYHDLATVLDDASAAAADFQSTVQKASEQDPEGFRDSPEVATAIEEQQAAVEEREAALTELAEHPAMGDEELAAAYEDFRTQYAEATAYQDGFNDSYPAFLVSNDVCTAVFESGPQGAPTYQAYARAWLRSQQKASKPCLKVNEELSESTNEDIAAVAQRWGQLVQQRLTAINAMALGSAGSDETLRAVKKANDSFVKDYGKLSKFSDVLGELYPDEAYDAIDTIFEDRLGEDAEPSDGESDGESDGAGDEPSEPVESE